MEDNYSEYTPILLEGISNWYAGKGLPTYSIHQAAGTPTLSMSTYAFFYPLVHFSYIVARYIFLDTFQFNNIFAFIHLLAGYFFFILFLKKKSISSSLACIGSLSFVFCGFSIMGIRSQYYIAPSVAFLPLLFYLAAKWEFNFLTWKRILVMTGLTTIYLYSGSFQFTVYTFCFFILYVVVVGSGMRKSNAIALASIFTISILLFSPLAIATSKEIDGLVRAGNNGCGIVMGWLPLLGLPVKARMPCHWGPTALEEYSAHFFHGAGILISITLISVVFKVKSNLRRAFNLVLQRRRIFYLMFALAFLLSAGRPGLLWFIHAQLPVFSNFQFPFKFLLYVQFFGIICGITALTYFQRKVRFNVIALFIAGQFIYLIWHVWNSRQAYYVYSYQTPYSSAAWMQKHNPENQRFCPVFPWRSFDQKFDAVGGLNFATAYNVMSTYVYEPLIPNLPNFYKYHREYGVRYFVLSKHTSEYEWEVEPNVVNKKITEYENWTQLDTVYQDQHVLVLENNEYAPLVQLYNSTEQKIESSFTLTKLSDGVAVHIKSTSEIPQAVMLNFFWRPALRVWIDGHEVPVNKDRYGRVRCTTNGKCKSIRMCYDPFSFINLFRL